MFIYLLVLCCSFVSDGEVRHISLGTWALPCLRLLHPAAAVVANVCEAGTTTPTLSVVLDCCVWLVALQSSSQPAAGWRYIMPNCVVHWTAGVRCCRTMPTYNSYQKVVCTPHMVHHSRNSTSPTSKLRSRCHNRSNPCCHRVVAQHGLKLPSIELTTWLALCDRPCRARTHRA